MAVNTTVEADFKMTAEQLEAAITPRTKLLIFLSVQSDRIGLYQEELLSHCQGTARHPQVYILSDEIYEHINFLDAHQSIAHPSLSVTG